FLDFVLRPRLDALQLVLPEPLEILDPFVNRFEPFPVEPVDTLPAGAPLAHETHLPKHAKVLGNLRLRPPERFYKVVNRPLPLGLEFVRELNGLLYRLLVRDLTDLVPGLLVVAAKQHVSHAYPSRGRSNGVSTRPARRVGPTNCTHYPAGRLIRRSTFLTRC